MEYFDQAINLINSNVAMAPYVIFGLLFLAGFNIPVSEDIMLFTSAILAAKNPDYLWPLFGAVFAGAYISDLICYGLIGRYFGEKLFRIKFFASMITPKKIEKINSFFKKYGIFALIFGRFIPFGFRNGLFLTAGLGKMNAWKFAISDFIACSISVVIYFSIYYHYGETAIYYVKKGNYVIAGLALIGLCFLAFKKYSKSIKIQ